MSPRALQGSHSQSSEGKQGWLHWGISWPGPVGPMPRHSLGTRQHHPRQVRTQRNWGASHAHPEPPWRGPPVPPSPGLVVEKGPHLPLPIPLLWGPGQSWA